MNSTGDLRIWRLRKRNLYVDAELTQLPDSEEWLLNIYYGTTLTSSRRCATRADAVAEGARRAERTGKAGPFTGERCADGLRVRLHTNGRQCLAAVTAMCRTCETIWRMP